jgi:hypothetical protein
MREKEMHGNHGDKVQMLFISECRWEGYRARFNAMDIILYPLVGSR